MTTPTRAARVELERVGRFFANAPASRPVIDNFDLTIRPGEFVSLLGPSGCGKSTLLRLIAGLDQPDAGAVRTESFGRRFFRGFVFQEAHLLPWRTALENAVLPLELTKQPKAQAREAAREALIKVGLGEHLDKYPGQLSGGMKMRVSVARALVAQPSLLLLDEPFAALDEHTRFHLQEDLRSLWEQEGLTVIFVTHSVSEAVYLSQRSIVLSTRPARIVEDTRVELPAQRNATTRLMPAYTSEIHRITQAYRSGEGSA